MDVPSRTGILVFASTAGILSVMILEPGRPYYNRYWHSIAHTPADLELRELAPSGVYRQLSPRQVFSTNVSRAYFYLPDENWPQSIARTIGQSASTGPEDIVRHVGVIPPTRMSVTVMAHRLRAANHNSCTVINIPPWESGDNPLLPQDATANPAHWSPIFGGTHAEAAAPNTSGLCAGSSALQNPAGMRCDVFHQTLVPVRPDKSYSLAVRVRRTEGANAAVYLAVAWYDPTGKVLFSSTSAPEGANSPKGWTNATFSYFGLVGSSPPSTWTQYHISFGWGQVAQIPNNARFLRVGALLNYTDQIGAVIQLAEVDLHEISTPDTDIVIPSNTALFSSRSQAGQLSAHWSATESISCTAGVRELKDMAAHWRKIRMGTRSETLP